MKTGDYIVCVSNYYCWRFKLLKEYRKEKLLRIDEYKNKKV
jgi:hypothetical protein